MVKNTPSNAGDAGSIPSRGTEIPHATGQLSLPLQTTSREKPTHGTKTQSSQKQIIKATKRPKTPTANSEKLEAKTGCQDQKQSTAHVPCTQYHQRGGQTT